MLASYSLVARTVTVAISRILQYGLRYDGQEISQIEVMLSRKF